MKNLLFLLLLLPCFVVKSQSIINPDTVCYQTSGSIYQIDDISGVTFEWTILAPGNIVSGQGTNLIEVDWSNALPGLINNAVMVTALGQNCPVDPVYLDVFIYQPVVNINPIGPFCTGDPCIDLTADIQGGLFSGTGVVNGQFCPNISGNGNFIITYNSFSNTCPVSGTINVIVNNSIILGPIEHN